jgi:hypothetical protein
VHCSKKCGEYGGRRVQRAGGTEDFGPWLRVASPSRRTSQRPGWSKSRTRERWSDSHSNEEPMESQSWRGSDREGDAGRRKHEARDSGGTVTGNEGEKGLFSMGKKIPNLERKDSGKGVMEGSDFNVDFINNQDIPSEEEGDNEGLQQIQDFTDLGPKIDALNKAPQKEPAGGENRMDDSSGNNYLAKERIYKTGSEAGEAIKGGTEGRKSGSIYVGQWNQIKEQMEWNLMEGRKEDFCPSVDAMLPTKGARQSIKPRRTYKKAFLGSSQSKLKGSAGHVNISGPGSKMGDKKREHDDGPADSSPGSSHVQPTSDLRPSSLVDHLGQRELCGMPSSLVLIFVG